MLLSIHTWSMYVRSPFRLYDIKLVEGVQRRATQLSWDFRNEPCNIRLATLGLPTLQFRRDRADMLQLFKILNRYEDIDSSRFFTLSSTGLCGHILNCSRRKVDSCYASRPSPSMCTACQIWLEGGCPLGIAIWLPNNDGWLPNTATQGIKW